jgi:hypothetical protein
MSAQAKNGNGHATAEDEPPPVTEAPPKGNDLRQRIDQMGTILAKGLDLAEAGVSLGVTIISRVGVAAQQKIMEGLDAASAPAAPESTPQPQQEQAQAEPEFGITNRLPLTPGGTVRISFSVNNDSMTEPKKVELRVEGFVGDSGGAHLDPAQFAIKPAQKTIAPVDFEKFVLQGAVQADVPPDIYRGAVVVDSGSTFRIPVVLVVMPL